MLTRSLLAISLIALFPAASWSAPREKIILIVRHGEKPETGPELTEQGQKRAQAYVGYFENFKLDGKAVHIDELYATADSKNSERERLTLEPLSKALGEPLHNQYKNKQVGDLATELLAKPVGDHILVCWHHGQIPNLVKALGADPSTLIPDGKWPGAHFDWVVVLRYDASGKLEANKTQILHEHLLPGDAP